MLDPLVMLQQTVNFFLLLFFLTYILYKPVGRVLEKRRERIAHDLAQAQKDKEQAHSLHQQAEEDLKKARREARDIVERAARQGMQMREEKVARARREVKLWLERTREEIKRERALTWEELQTELANLSVLTAAKIIEKSLDEQAHQDLVASIVSTLDEQPMGPLP